jgi:prepilin-type N-terminal cleavage/methylation domain-containing protein
MQLNRKTKGEIKLATPLQATLRGFSLMEIMAAAVILGILAAVIVPRLVNHQDAAKKSACYASKGDIELQAKLWRRNVGSYPAANLSDVGASTTYFPSGIPTCPVDGTAYTIDTTTGRVIGHAH